ncbi:hypothetical protein HPP92_016611 [Vanilla planifolia]|uniref:Uncharacterized protein n=1 Tax=Vanilla planifolia TaxID=51239 RepID=A0A835QKF7_VANPL|nr:hypothetical protein HPP92_016611 [Vanilla planifolia]
MMTIAFPMHKSFSRHMVKRNGMKVYVNEKEFVMKSYCDASLIFLPQIINTTKQSKAGLFVSQNIGWTMLEIAKKKKKKLVHEALAFPFDGLIIANKLALCLSNCLILILTLSL